MSGYTPQRRKKTDIHMSPEEWEVSKAMEKAGYTFDPYDGYSFTPTYVLHRVYREYVAQSQWRTAYDGVEPVTLNPSQFGIALGTVFGFTRDDGFRVQRWYHGQKCWGYIGMKGPDSIETNPLPGRPPKDGMTPREREREKRRILHDEQD